MQTIPGLKKCFDFVASLSKKLLSATPMPAIRPISQKTEQKSSQKQSSADPSKPKSNELQMRQEQATSGQKIERPKVINFDTFVENRPNPLKVPTFQLGSGATYTYQKPVSKIDPKSAKIQESKDLDPIHKNYPYKKLENRYSNQIRPTYYVAIDKTQKNRNLNSQETLKKGNKDPQNSADDELSDEDFAELGKKDKKNLKKQDKNASVAQCLDINTDDMIFTYDDGDDISSIAAKSQTTDEIEPELLSFISKKAMINNFNRIEDQKFNNFPSANMKKKSTHYQGETVPSKSSNIVFPKQPKAQIELIPKPKPKKRAFQLYPGETFQQFKKRILIPSKSSSSQNSDDDNYFPGKLIKKEEYERILSQLSCSISKMEEQKNKEASILVVQKMVDESQNEESENRFILEQPILQNIENYKVWDNAGDNASFRLYYRDD